MGNTQTPRSVIEKPAKKGMSFKDLETTCNCCSSANEMFNGIVSDPSPYNLQEQCKLLRCEEILVRISLYLELDDVHRLQTTCRRLIKVPLVTPTHCELYLKRKFCFSALDCVFEGASSVLEVRLNSNTMMGILHLIKQDKGNMIFFVKNNLKELADQTEHIFRRSKKSVSSYNYQEDCDFTQSHFQYQMSQVMKRPALKLQPKKLSSRQLQWLDEGYALLDLAHMVLTKTILVESLNGMGIDIPMSIQEIQFISHHCYRVCDWVERTLSTMDDDRQRLKTFVLFWQHYQACIEQLCSKHSKSFLELLEYVEGAFGSFREPDFRPTLHHNLTRVWCSTLMNTSPVKMLNYNFDALFVDILRCNFEDICNSGNRNSMDYYSDSIILQKYVNSLLDMSINEHSVHWMGHSQFQLQPQLQALIQMVYDHIVNILFDAKTTPFEEVFYQFRKLMIYLNDIFPLWITDYHFEIPLTIEIQKLYEEKLSALSKEDCCCTSLRSSTRTLDTRGSTRIMELSDVLRQNINSLEKRLHLIPSERQLVREFCLHAQQTLQRIESRDICLKVTNQVNKIQKEVNEDQVLLTDLYVQNDTHAYRQMYTPLKEQQSCIASQIKLMYDDDGDDIDMDDVDLGKAYLNMADLINQQVLFK